MGYKEQDIAVEKNLYDRVSKLLESFECSDCCFSVSGQKFRAHKLIFGISSPVFKAMFYGPLSSNDIIITDIEPDVFQLLINYIYTDKVFITNIEQAFELLYASKKYLLKFLTEKCMEYIEKYISLDNVISILNYSEYFQETRLINLSLFFLCEHADYILNQSVEKLSSSSLKLILECESINILEISLINLVIRWTTNYLENNDIPKTLENTRNILISKDLFDKLRFLCLSKYDLENLITKCNYILDPRETDFIKKSIESTNKTQYINTSDKSCNIHKILSKNRKVRNPINIVYSLCHRTLINSASPLIIDSSNNKIYVKVRCNKTVFIKSLGIPTRMSSYILPNGLSDMYSEQLLVTVHQEQEQSDLLSSTYFKNNVEYDSNVFIKFTEPFVFKSNEWYRICFQWPQNNRSFSYKYIVSHRSNVAQNKANFEFEDVMTSFNNNGSFLESLKFS